mgnify:CR=1 FL=1
MIFGKIISFFADHKKIERQKINQFKEMLVSDLPHYESNKTTLNAVILNLFPRHDEEYRKLHIYLSDAKKKYLDEKWEAYSSYHSQLSGLEDFAVVMMEMPHPDFDQTPRMAEQLERKKKIKIVTLVRDIIEGL